VSSAASGTGQDERLWARFFSFSVSTMKAACFIMLGLHHPFLKASARLSQLVSKSCGRPRRLPEIRQARQADGRQSVPRNGKRFGLHLLSRFVLITSPVIGSGTAQSSFAGGRIRSLRNERSSNLNSTLFGGPIHSSAGPDRASPVLSKAGYRALLVVDRTEWVTLALEWIPARSARR
jgi:hypothetical protein